MKKTIVIIAAALAVLAGVVWASDRLRVIAVDGDSAPVYTTAKSVSLTPAVTATQTVSGLTIMVTNAVKAAATQAAVTIQSNIVTLLYISAPNTTGTLVVAIVTNVVQSGAPFGFATTTPQVVQTNNIANGTEVVTNAVIANTDGGYGFSGAQAGAILTNANLFYRMLQSY